MSDIDYCPACKLSMKYHTFSSLVDCINRIFQEVKGSKGNSKFPSDRN